MYLPLNIGIIYITGSILSITVLILVTSGIILSICYQLFGNFNSIELINRRSNLWIFRDLHLSAAFILFLTIFIHVLRGYWMKNKNQLKLYVWLTGSILFLGLLFISITGSSIPWSNTSLWASVVVISSVKLIGNWLIYLIFGDLIPSATRLGVIHIITGILVPLVIIFHINELHKVGSSKFVISQLINFEPLHYIRDIEFWLLIPIFLIIPIFSLRDPAGWERANELITPEEIQPAIWLFPWYTTLKSSEYFIIGLILTICLLIFPFIHFKLSVSKYYRKFLIFYFSSLIILLIWNGLNNYNYYSIYIVILILLIKILIWQKLKLYLR